MILVEFWPSLPIKLDGTPEVTMSVIESDERTE